MLGVASAAKSHLDHARLVGKGLSPAAAAALLPSLGCEAYLRRLEACNFDVFHASLAGVSGGGDSGGGPKMGTDLMYVLRVRWHLWQGTF